MHVANWRKYYPQNFRGVGSFFMKAIFSCLNFKPDYGFLAYSMPESFNKTEHSLTYIIIGLKFKPVLHPEFF